MTRQPHNGGHWADEPTPRGPKTGNWRDGTSVGRHPYVHPQRAEQILDHAATWYGGQYKRRGPARRWWLTAGRQRVVVAVAVALGLLFAIPGVLFPLGILEVTPDRIMAYIGAGATAILVLLSVALWARRE